MFIYTEAKPISQRSTQSNTWEEIAALEKRFPRIAGEICSQWQSRNIDHYIDGLLLDDRGDRMGFPIEVLDELMFLAGIRWHLNHLCGTVIESTSAEPFNFTGSQNEYSVTDPKTWVLI